MSAPLEDADLQARFDALRAADARTAPPFAALARPPAPRRRAWLLVPALAAAGAAGVLLIPSGRPPVREPRAAAPLDFLLNAHDAPVRGLALPGLDASVSDEWSQP